MSDTDQIDNMRMTAFQSLAAAMESLLFDRLDAAAAQKFTATALQEIRAMLALAAGAASSGGTHHG